MNRIWLQYLLRKIIVALSVVLAGCAAIQQQPELEFAEYSASQIIETTPGPFVNTIYISRDRERQDASLGGKTVTTIIRRDKGVAWLLMPDKQEYEEVELERTAPVSIQASISGLKKRRVGEELMDGLRADKFACYDSSGRLVSWAWIDEDGIVLKSEILADTHEGKPGAIIRLEHLRFAKQEPDLFELPPGYRKSNLR